MARQSVIVSCENLAQLNKMRFLYWKYQWFLVKPVSIIGQISWLGNIFWAEDVFLLNGFFKKKLLWLCTSLILMVVTIQYWFAWPYQCAATLSPCIHFQLLLQNIQQRFYLPNFKMSSLFMYFACSGRRN